MLLNIKAIKEEEVQENSSKRLESGLEKEGLKLYFSVYMLKEKTYM